MTTILGKSALEGKANRPNGAVHHDRMPKSTPKKVDQEESSPDLSVVARNLLAIKGPKQSVNAFAQRAGVNQTTMNRLLNGHLDPSLTTIQRIADHLHLQAWQLVHPEGPAARFSTVLSEEAMEIANRLDSITDPQAREVAVAKAYYAAFRPHRPSELAPEDQPTGERLQSRARQRQP